MKLNNKGFAISSIMYMILVMAVILISLILATLSSRRLILEKLKSETIKYILNEPICTLISDSDSSGSITIGDVIKCETESFYVIKNDGQNIAMLAKYNLDVGNVCEGINLDNYSSSYLSCKSYFELTNPTGLQNKISKGGDGDSLGVAYGVLQFSIANYWWNSLNNSFAVDSNYIEESKKYPYVYGNYESENGLQQNLIYEYIENYKRKLEIFDVDVIEARLISYEELENLGCIGAEFSCKSSKYPWVYSTTYWTGSAYNYASMWSVDTYGSLGDNGWNLKSYLGIRPVITVPIDKIEN